MMGGSESGFSPKSSNPRIFGDDEMSRVGPQEDGESHGRVKLVEVKNSPNPIHHSLSKESLEFQSAPPPGGGFYVGNSIGAPHQSRKSSLSEFETELLASQFAKKEKLRLVVQTKQAELASLRRDVQFLQKQLEPILRIEKLKKDNERLQHQCNILTSEVDSYTDGSIPLGETSAEFYRERSPRQDANPIVPMSPLASTSGAMQSSSRSPVGRLPTGSHQLPTGPTRKVPPPRPPPPNSLRLNAVQWECSKCTFRNHPDLNICEQCEMLRIIPSVTSTPNSTESHGPFTPSSPYYYPQTRPAT